MLDALIKILNSEEEEDRICAVYDIGEKETSRGALPLAKRLNMEKSQAVKDSIVFMLKKLDISPAFEELFSLFLSPDAYLRNASVSILGSDGESAIAYLTSKLDHSDKEIRKLILDALVEIGSEDAVLAIRAALYDEAPNVKITAAEYLGRLDDRKSVPDLIKFFEEDPEPMFRATIIDSLALIGQEETIKKIISILFPEKDIKELDPVYIPQLLRLAGKTGDREDILLITGSLEDISFYADDIIIALTDLKKRFNFEIPDDTLLKGLLGKIVEHPSIREELKYSALSLAGRMCLYLQKEE